MVEDIKESIEKILTEDNIFIILSEIKQKYDYEGIKTTYEKMQFRKIFKIIFHNLLIYSESSSKKVKLDNKLIIETINGDEILKIFIIILQEYIFSKKNFESTTLKFFDVIKY